MIRFVSLLLAFFCLGACPAWSQTPATPAPVVRIDFSVFAAERYSDFHFEPRPGVAPVNLEFFTAQRSKVYRYEGPLPLTFFRLNADGTRTVVGSVASLPPETTRVLVLFFPESANSETIRAVVFPDDTKTLPYRHVNILNATGIPLLAKIGDSQVNLGRGLSAAFRAPPPTDPIQVAMRIEDRTPIVCTSAVELEGRSRATLVLFPPKSRNRPLLPSRLLIEEFEPDPSVPAENIPR
jgi:hypothetical protein